MTQDFISGHRREVISLTTARVRDVYLRKPHYVEAAVDLTTVCAQMSTRGIGNVLVRDEGRVGIFTTTDLREAIASGGQPSDTPVGRYARFDLLSIDADSDLFEALWLMLRQRVHRLVVLDAQEVIGVLGQLDLISFVASHSHIVTLQIDEAGSIDDLAEAAARIDEMVAMLHVEGIRIDRIARLISELNARLLARLWTLLAPETLRDNSCLVVLGSEGRREQIVKTDQDNALILRDGFAYDGLEAICQQFNDALNRFGYPPCPGGIMLSNPVWRQSVGEFRRQLGEWLFAADATGVMNVAIFYDAAAVAGDAELLAQVRRFLTTRVSDSDAFFARFAQPAMLIGDRAGWWRRMGARLTHHGESFDLKKLGVFPIVHGVRSLALRHGIVASGTVDRLGELVRVNAMPAELARDLTDALHFLMQLRLSNNLQQRQGGQASSNQVQRSNLSRLEHETLQNSLAIIKSFRQYLSQVFRLDSI